jgi:hypothetical protein
MQNFCIYGRNHSLHQLKHTVAHPKKENGGEKKKKKKDLLEAYGYYSLVDKVLGIEFQIQYFIVEPMPTILLKCGGVVVCKIIPNCKILSPRMKTL